MMLLSFNMMGQQKVYYTSTKMLNKIPATGKERPKFTYKIISLNNQTYGYDIFANDVLLFHQTEMPGKSAGIGFANTVDASKVAERVILKLENPIAPPIVIPNIEPKPGNKKVPITNPATAPNEAPIASPARNVSCTDIAPIETTIT